MKLSKFSSVTHKWLGLVLGIQVVLWFVSGVVMTWFDIELIRSEHNIREYEQTPIQVNEERVSLNQALSVVNGVVVGTQIKYLGEDLVYQFSRKSDVAVLVDAITGEKISPISDTRALSLAIRDFAGDGRPTGATLLNETGIEYRGPLPIWYVDMKDKEETHLYINPNTGRGTPK